MFAISLLDGAADDIHQLPVILPSVDGAATDVIHQPAAIEIISSGSASGVFVDDAAFDEIHQPESKLTCSTKALVDVAAAEDIHQPEIGISTGARATDNIHQQPSRIVNPYACVHRRRASL